MPWHPLDLSIETVEFQRGLAPITHVHSAIIAQEAAKLVTKETMAKSVVCGPDSGKFHQQIKAFADAGFENVYIHQIGPDQDGFFDFAKRELLPGELMDNPRPF